MFRFPWTNEHELNLDWIIRTVKSLLRRVKTLEESGGGGGGAEPYDSTPAALGVASPGVSDLYARGDHVHSLPAYGDLLIPVVTDSSIGNVTKTIESDKIYHFTGSGITALNLVLDNVGNKHYHFDFISGTTPPTITIPGVSWVNGFFTPAANTEYEVDILDGMGVYAAWPI